MDMLLEFALGHCVRLQLGHCVDFIRNTAEQWRGFAYATQLDTATCSQRIASKPLDLSWRVYLAAGSTLQFGESFIGG